MALTLANLESHVTHSLGQATPSTPGAAKQIVNEAGRALYSARAWKFREHASASLNFVADQQTVALPADFGEMQAWTAEGLTQSFQLTTLQEILLFRSKAILPVGFVWFGAVVHKTPESPGHLSSVLEVYPTPTVNQENALNIFYRREWKELDESTDIPNIPTWCESLLIQYVRAFAESYSGRAENATLANMSTATALTAMLASIEAGHLFKSAVRRDSASQRSYGPIKRGAASVPQTIGPFDSRPVSDPFIT